MFLKRWLKKRNSRLNNAFAALAELFERIAHAATDLPLLKTIAKTIANAIVVNGVLTSESLCVMEQRVFCGLFPDQDAKLSLLLYRRGASHEKQ
ncbi:MAG: hypothetical protein CTY36_01360 [Methylocystis sp.]|nr:MAG: hypothetical protein CTY36_01360 [Methylocystis sp.]